MINIIDGKKQGEKIEKILSRSQMDAKEVL